MIALGIIVISLLTFLVLIELVVWLIMWLSPRVIVWGRAYDYEVDGE